MAQIWTWRGSRRRFAAGGPLDPILALEKALEIGRRKATLARGRDRRSLDRTRRTWRSLAFGRCLSLGRRRPVDPIFQLSRKGLGALDPDGQGFSGLVGGGAEIGEPLLGPSGGLVEIGDRLGEAFVLTLIHK